MFKNYLLKSWLLLLCMVVGVGSAWAADDVSMLTFTAACNGSGTADDGAVWAVTSDGTESNFTTTKGIHYGTGSAEVQYIQLSTSDISGTITKVVVNASTASGVTASVSVNVGGSAFGGSAQSVSTSPADYTFVGSASGEIVVKLEKPSKALKALYVLSVAVTYTTGGGATLENSDLSLTGAPITLTFDLYNDASAKVINYTSSSTGDVTIADSEYATFAIDKENKTITVTPTAVTPSAQTITVNQAADETYKTGSATFTLTITDSTPLPTYTVTFGDEGSVTQETPGAEVTLPSRSEKAGYAFAGWSETNVTEETTTDPGIIPAGSYTPTANITLYPVYTKTEGGGGTTNKTASVNIGTYATANSWSNSTQYEDITIDEYITATANGGGNTGKYYSSNSTWRLYATESAKLVIGGLTEGKLTSVTITYTGNKLTYGGNDVTSGTAVSVSGTSAEFAVSGSSSNSQVTAISVDYTISGAGTTYYWSAPVAAAVARPTIEVAENPFMFSTTATITCETEGAAIKYSFDDETWNDYSDPLTITATTTIYAKAIKAGKESAVASVTATKNLIVPTVDIDNSGITNTDVYVGTEAGSLAATVIYEEAVQGAVVTWSGNNDEVATIDAETGAVTLVAAGTVTFTATYAGNSDYAEKTATYEMTVTNSDPNAPGTENNPYTVAQALENTPASGTSANVYIRGIVSAFYKTSITGDGTNYRYYISDDGTTTNQMLVYRGKGLNNVAFSAADNLLLGDVVTIVGGLTTYNTTKEVASGNYIVSLVRKPAAPEFSVAEGEYAETQTVVLTAEDGTTIYYTLDGTDPTTESSVYSEALTIEETTTLKAIAVKDEMSSDVATATYTINKAPFITVAETAIEAEAAGKDGTIEVTYNNMTQDEFVADVVYCDAEGNEVTAATYGWIIASINEQTNNIDYLIEENTSTEARTAYIKVYALYDDDDYFSDIITFTQAGMVVDYATLPFEYDGNATGELPAGLTQEGLGTKTYANSPKIGFDTTGDELVLKINEAPNSLFFNIKGNSFSEGTFTVQTSVDGVDYTDLKAYTDLGATQTEIFNLNADVRYIKWVYTEKVNGNVALGNIKVSANAAVTISAAKYATFSNNRATDFSETGITVYTAKVNGNYVTLTQVEDGIVPANTGVVLFSETADTYEVPFTTTENSLEDNDLLISDGTIAGDGSTIFALANKNQGVGFYRVAKGVAVPAGTPYLTIEAAAREFFGFGSETTSINGALSIKNGASVDAPVYNLNGQRILKPAKGLYIVNGKKAVIK